MDYFNDTWQNLSWSPWAPFTADAQIFRQIPKEPGLYRIRPVGKDFLMYIGETRRTVHQRLNELRHTLRRSDLMPWNDPHTAAPSLWAWQDAEGYEYECSAASLDAPTNSRRGMECFLLYQYRKERGESTLCNFGRFHPRYRKSTNRKENSRGGKSDENQNDNPAGGPSQQPLHPSGKPGDLNWMGLAWSNYEPLVTEKIRNAPTGSVLYVLSESGLKEVIYIGQSMNCAKRLRDHSKKSWDEKSVNFCYHELASTILPHQLKELENDLIGNFFELYRRAPEYQFMNIK
jgi:hypothetical protein